MELKYKYQKIKNSNVFKDEYKLEKVGDLAFVGIDDNAFPVFIISSEKTIQSSISLRSNKIGIKCNVLGEFKIENRNERILVHIIKCYSKIEKEIDIFFDICETFFNKTHAVSSENVLNTYSILASIFENSKTYSENELQGLYSELFVIKQFGKKYPIYKYWHTIEKMKFDFSISTDFRIEVKSTCKDERIHHFTHDQLFNDDKIYVFSYLMRRDDRGYSLYDLILEMRTLLKQDHDAILILNKILKNTDYDILKSIKYNEQYLIENLRIFDVKNIPKFKQKAPEGVLRTEYDCNLEKCEYINLQEFFEIFKDSINLKILEE